MNPRRDIPSARAGFASSDLDCEHCITCGDDGVPMRVLKIREDLGLCEDPKGAHHTVELALVDAGPGDQVLVHAGVALVTL